MRGINHIILTTGVLTLIAFIVVSEGPTSTIPKNPRTNFPTEKYVVIGSSSWAHINSSNPSATSAASSSKEQSIEPPEGYTFWKEVPAKVTAYEPSSRSCGDFADGKTSTGKNAWVTDGVAVDPEAIPYGAKIWIPGVGFREADDTGAAMRNSWENEGIYHLDLRMKYIHKAREWGVQNHNVKIFLPSYFSEK